MPTQEIPLTAELGQCPEAIQVIIGDIIKEVRGTTRGRRNFSLEFSAMRAVANSLSLDPTDPRNRGAITTEQINGIETQVRAAIQASYDLTHKRKKKPTEPSTDAPLEPNPQPNATTATAPEPGQISPQSIMAGLSEETIAQLDGEHLQQLIKDLKKTRENLQRVIDVVRTECAKKRPQETNVTVEQALTHPEQVRNCFTFRNLVVDQDLAIEQQITLLKSGIKLAKEEEMIRGAMGMLIRLGIVYERNGKFVEAIEAFEEVLRLQAENHHQKPEDIEKTVVKIIRLRSAAKTTTKTNNVMAPKELEVTLPTPKTAENTLKACHNLATSRKFDEGEAMADMAIRYFTADDRFEMQKIGFQATKVILAKPSTIRSLQIKQLIAASFTLERAGELELAKRCLEELLTRTVSPRARQTSTERINKISAELSAQKRPQQPVAKLVAPSNQPQAPVSAPTVPASVPASAPISTPATPPKQEKPRERSQAERARQREYGRTT